MKNLTQWLVYLESLHPSEIDLGLSRISLVMDRLSLKRPQQKIITVAGTNGKGTTLACLQHLLSRQGYSTGLYTSPHIHVFNERVQLSGQFVGDDALVAAFALIESVREEISLTYFEYTTLAAFIIFSQSDLDFWLLEVGLGGRLDAINAIDPDIAVITTIDLDHQAWLGNTREQVAFEKAGIMRETIPVVVGELNPPQVLSDRASLLHVDYYQRNEAFRIQYNEDGSADYINEKANVSARLPVKLCVPVDNVATALTVYTLIEGYLEQTDVDSLASVTVQGRFQVIHEKPMVVVDVAHNRQSAQYLAEKIASLAIKGDIYAVFGVLDDKDIACIVQPFKQLVSQWYIAALNVPRAASLEKMKNILAKSVGVNHTFDYKLINSAYDSVLGVAKSDDLIVVFGSFYTVSNILKHSNNV